MNKFYAGIGARITPPEIQNEMCKVSSYLESCGYILRSGNALGADQAFALGVKKRAQIWLPWENFQAEFRAQRPQHDYKIILPSDSAAYQSVIDYHPRSKWLNVASRKFMSRNYRQVIGMGEPNSEFIICWTPRGKESGGTSQALRIAKVAGIHILNMYEFKTFESIKNHLKVWYGI